MQHIGQSRFQQKRLYLICGHGVVCNGFRFARRFLGNFFLFREFSRNVYLMLAEYLADVRVGLGRGRLGLLRSFLRTGSSDLLHKAVPSVTRGFVVAGIAVETQPVCIERSNSSGLADNIVYIVFLQPQQRQLRHRERSFILEHAAGKEIINVGDIQRTVYRSDHVFLVFRNDPTGDFFVLRNLIYRDRTVLFKQFIL